MNKESIFGSSKTEKINQFLMLMKDPDVQPTFRMYIENVLATSELNILKRLTTIETILELNDYPIEDDEAESTILKQIALLSNQMKEVIITNNKQSILEPIHESVHIGMSKTTARAILLFKDVIKVASEGKDQIVIGSREIKNYLTNHIEPEYRVGDVSNFRKVKKDVLTTLKKLLPDNVLLDKKNYGRREIRLVYES
jgi:arsenate reductase-like glutaredoxin family protein